MSNALPLKKRLTKPVGHAIRWSTRPLRDALQNRRYASAAEQILLVRHRVHITSYYTTILEWLADELPEVRQHFKLVSLPTSQVDWSRCRLVVPWVSENMVSRCPRTYRQLKSLETTARSHGIDTLNQVDQILQAPKLEAAQAIAAAGVRTPHMVRIENIDQFRRDLAGQQPPLLIRENKAHGGNTPSYLIHSAAEAAQVPIETLEEPIAVEFIDVQNKTDGYYRKYRYLAAGSRGIAMSVQIAGEWEVRGCKRDLCESTRHEEAMHQRQEDPNHEQLQRVREKLGLDVVAFDYSYTPDGELVVWEINVLPGMGIPTDPSRQYLAYGVRRAMASLVELYFTRAGLEVPESVQAMIETGEPPQCVARRVA